jgi:hypothetical protein
MSRFDDLGVDDGRWDDEIIVDSFDPDLDFDEKNTDDDDCGTVHVGPNHCDDRCDED